MRTRELKGLIVAKDGNQMNLAKAMNLSLSRLNAKINETGGAQFNKSEIEFIRDRYNLSTGEVGYYFFEETVS
jgi:DNA-binding transcriptional regulator YiaG